MHIDAIRQRFNQVAQEYDEFRRSFIPCFDDFYGQTVEFLARCYPNASRIMDLGAGTGLLTKYLFAYYPHAQFTLVDASDQMLEMAKLRFKDFDCFTYEVRDYSVSLPLKQFDMITSALSIHHLDEKEKLSLFKNIWNQLPVGGVFVNFDIFNGANDFLTQQYNASWYDFIEKSMDEKRSDDSWRLRRELDKENTVVETESLLQISGFSTVECLYRNQKFAVVFALK